MGNSTGSSTGGGGVGLLVIDMQHSYFDAAGPHARAGYAVDRLRPVLPGVLSVLHKCRHTGVPVFFTQMVIGEGSPITVARRMVPDAFRHGSGDRLKVGSGGTAIAPELSPRADEHIIGKQGYSAFHETGLALELRQRGVRLLIIVGIVSYVCVLHTAFDAFCHGFDLAVVEDGVGGWDDGLNGAALNVIRWCLGRVISSADVDGLLGQEIGVAGTRSV